MKSYLEMNEKELSAEREKLLKEYSRYKKLNMSLDMSRGKPSPDMLDLSDDIMDVLDSGSDLMTEDGFDARNYGVMDGLIETKRLFADLMDLESEDIIVYGNSSLNIMYDRVSHAFTHGVMGGEPLYKCEKRKWICVVPGYDRHFRITDYFGFENVCVPMLEDGPDMDMVEMLVNNDPTIKGMWCVPKYANPTGISYSDEVVKRLARLKPASRDFRIYWDDAYTVHHLYDEHDEVLNILRECADAGNADMVYIFASTAKMAYPGNGISMLAASQNNLKAIREQMAVQLIGHDKINQLRYVRYLKDAAHVAEHMKALADMLRPKFEMVEGVFRKELGELGIARWTEPKGGYFISLWVMEGCAKRTYDICASLGVKLTEAGATYPGGIDPQDSNLRIAPSYPSPEELRKASEVLVLAVKLACVEKIMNVKALAA